jgi:hypothetical protein
MRRHLRTVLVVLVTVGLLALFLRQVNLGEVAREIRRASLLDLLLAILTTLSVYVFRAIRWQAMLEPIGRARFVPAFRTTVIGFAANTLLPARAGEFLRPYLLARQEGLSATSTFATIVLERVLDLVTILFLFALFVFLFDPGMASVDDATYRALKGGGLIAAAGVAGMLAVMFLLAGHPERLGRIVQRAERVLPPRFAHFFARLARTFAEGLAVLRRPGPLFRSAVLSLPVWLAITAGIWLVTRAFHIAMPFTGSFLVVALLAIGVTVPTPGAVGGFHYAYRVATTVFFAVPNERAVGAAIVLHAISFLPAALLGTVFMLQDGLSFGKLKSMAASKEGGAEGGGAP